MGVNVDCINHSLRQCSFARDNNILLGNITTFKKKQIYHKEARGEGRENSLTCILVCRLTVPAISGTCLKSENSARHPDIPHSCWALGTQNICWSEIPPSLGWVLTLNLSLTISCDKDLTGTPFGSCGLQVWQGLGTRGLLSKAQWRKAPVILWPFHCPALPAGPVGQGQFSLALGPFSGGPASSRRLDQAHPEA